LTATAVEALGVSGKKLMAALGLVVAGLTLAGCTQAQKQEAVEPVVRNVIETLLAPITEEAPPG